VGKDTNELDTREEDKARTEKRLGELEQEENEKEEMKTEDMSLEELVNKLRSVSYVSGTNDTDDYDDEIFNIKKQIISRFSTLTEKVKKLEEENQRWKNDVDITEAALGISGLYATKDKAIDSLTAENADLKRQIDNLQVTNGQDRESLKVALKQVEELKRTSQANGYDIDGSPICYKIT
jgi:cell division protein FtsB